MLAAWSVEGGSVEGGSGRGGMGNGFNALLCEKSLSLVGCMEPRWEFATAAGADALTLMVGAVDPQFATEQTLRSAITRPRPASMSFVLDRRTNGWV